MLSTNRLEPVHRRPTATVIAESIRARIMDGSFPAGAQLTEMQLAEQLEVSRGPIREALARLTQEGLLVAEPHRGVFVLTLEDEDVSDIYLARGVIEREVARLIIRRGDRAALRRLEGVVRDMAAAARGGTWSDVAEADLRFHETLVASSGSPRLVRMYATLLVETRLSFTELGRSYPDPRRVVAAHRELLRTVRAGDEADVDARFNEHFERPTGDGPPNTAAAGVVS